MDAPIHKPRVFFETADRPSHVTFDDGRLMRRNFPWHHYVEARWSYGAPDMIEVVIGDCLVHLSGRNLAPLFTALEEHALLRVRARVRPEGTERDCDSYVTQIRFEKPAAPAKRQSGQSEPSLDPRP